MGKLPKDVKKILRHYAANLPVSVYKGSEKIMVPLSELEQSQANEAKNRDGMYGGPKIVSEGQDIMMEQDRYYPVNHFRRMKKAFLAEGWPGVIKYRNWVSKNNEAINSEDDMKVSMITAEQIIKHKIKPFL